MTFTIARPVGATFVSALIAAPVAVLGAWPAAATPQDTDTPSCSYEISAPEQVTLPSGQIGVSSTVSVNACNGRIQPTTTTVCLEADGVPVQCQRGLSWNSATVVAAPWRAGVTYVASGSALAITGNPVQSVSTVLGPVSAML